MKKATVLLMLILVTLVISGCAAGPNEMADSPDNEGEVAGFWQGLWHGVIAPVTFVVSLFSDSVEVFEVHNNGGWYTFGFLLGASIIFGGSGRGSKRRR
jgi:uncharacterized spore protein YtfJ